MVVERFELPITFFAKWSYLWELMSDVQKHVIRFKPDTLEWAVDFGLLRVRRLARELRLEKKGGLRRAASAPDLVSTGLQRWAIVGRHASTSEVHKMLKTA